MSNHRKIIRTDRRTHGYAAAAFCAMATLAGCASSPPPREQLATSQTSIDAARSAGAAEFAPVEFTRATDKRMQAINAAQHGDMVAARRLAEESDADAQVARTKANAERSQRAAAEVAASLQALRNQLQNTPGSPGGGVLNPPAPAAGPRSTQPGGDTPYTPPNPPASKP